MQKGEFLIFKHQRKKIVELRLRPVGNDFTLRTLLNVLEVELIKIGTRNIMFMIFQ